jgi:hypothetical protein
MVTVYDCGQVIIELIGIGCVLCGLLGGGIVGGLIYLRKITMLKHRPIISVVLCMSVASVIFGGSIAGYPVSMYRMISVLFAIACFAMLFPRPRGRL